MYEVLSKAARYRDVLRIRHFVCECGVHRRTLKGFFMLKQKALCMLEELIRPSAYEWRIDCNCGRDCVSFEFEPVAHFVGRLLGFLYNLLNVRLYTYIVVIHDTVVMLTMCISCLVPVVK